MPQMDQRLMDDDSAVCAVGPVLLLFAVPHVRGYGRLLPVSLTRHISEAKRPAKGFVTGLVTGPQKTFYYRLLPQLRCGQVMSSRWPGLIKNVSDMPTSINAMLPTKGSCQFPVTSIR